VLRENKGRTTRGCGPIIFCHLLTDRHKNIFYGEIKNSVYFFVSHFKQPIQKIIFCVSRLKGPILQIMVYFFMSVEIIDQYYKKILGVTYKSFL
jgi:hypothetical protein